jgi:phosphatidylglycerophosphate synthase
VLDGVVARGTNSASPSGAFIDVLADFLLAISGLAGCMMLGKISLRVIMVSLLVFAQFVAGYGGCIVYDPFGRLFGVLVILCTPFILMGPSFFGHIVDSSILFLGFLSLLGRFIYLGKALPVRFHQLVSPDE